MAYTGSRQSSLIQ